jgi:hypothetical protein
MSAWVPLRSLHVAHPHMGLKRHPGGCRGGVMPRVTGNNGSHASKAPLIIKKENKAHWSKHLFHLLGGGERWATGVGRVRVVCGRQEEEAIRSRLLEHSKTMQEGEVGDTHLW